MTNPTLIIDTPTKEKMNGMIELDSEFAKEIGFTSDKFDGYLWRIDRKIIISVIWSLKEGCGNLSRLFEAIELRGFTVAVPTPSIRMASILRGKGLNPHVEETSEMGPVEIWEK